MTVAPSNPSPKPGGGLWRLRGQLLGMTGIRASARKTAPKHRRCCTFPHAGLLVDAPEAHCYDIPLKAGLAAEVYPIGWQPSDRARTPLLRTACCRSLES